MTKCLTLTAKPQGERVIQTDLSALEYCAISDPASVLLSYQLAIKANHGRQLLCQSQRPGRLAAPRYGRPRVADLADVGPREAAHIGQHDAHHEHLPAHSQRHAG